MESGNPLLIKETLGDTTTEGSKQCIYQSQSNYQSGLEQVEYAQSIDNTILVGSFVRLSNFPLFLQTMVSF